MRMIYLATEGRRRPDESAYKTFRSSSRTVESTEIENIPLNRRG